MKTIFLFFTLSLLICKLFGDSFSEKMLSPWGVDHELSASKDMYLNKKERVLPNTELASDKAFPLLPLSTLSKKEKFEPDYTIAEKSERRNLTLGQRNCRAMIRFFQVYISPIDGPRSSFYPTSSQYALEAIQKHGIFKGIAMGCDRLMRENGEIWVYERTTQYGPERKIDPVK